MKTYKAITAAVAIALPALASISIAGVIWDGGHATSNSWGSTTNWDANTLPAFDSTTDLVFGAAGFARPSSFISAARTVRSMEFNSNVSAPMNVNLFGFPVSPQVGFNLTMGGGGSASIKVNSGVSQSVTIGNNGAGVAGSIVLADNLFIDHQGSGLLLFNRNITGGFGITKSGSGTAQFGTQSLFTGAMNVNEGRLIVSSGTVSNDLDTTSAVNLGGGALEINANFFSKSFSVAPLNVTSASTLAYNNPSAANNYTMTLGGSAAFSLNADVTVQNISSSPTLQNNAINISRALTGAGDLTVSTLNNLASNSDNYSRQRVQLSGDNSGWTGDLVIAKGSGQLSGNFAQPAGSGSIVIGTTSDSFGAGLSFNQTSDVALNKNITVRSGGFRGIKSNNLSNADITTTAVTGYNIMLNGAVLLEGDLSIDHSLVNSSTPGPVPVVTASHYVEMTGNISGPGGLTVGRVHVAGVNGASSDGSQLVLSGTNTYTGATTIQSRAKLTLATTGSITSNTTVVDLATLRNNGTITGTVVVDSGGKLEGTGTIVGDTVVNGELTPGTSAGRLTWSGGNLALGDGLPGVAGAISTFEVIGAEGVVNAGITYDNVTLSSTAQVLTYDGTLNINFASEPTVPGTYDFFTFAGPSTGSFDNVLLTGAVAGPLTPGAGVFSATYSSMTYTFTSATGELVLSLTAVPEPLTAACVLVLSGRLLGRRSRQSI